MCSFTAPTLICFPIVVISTSILIFRLKNTRTWRDTVVKQPNSDSSKEKKVARSVIFICSMFIICFLPNIVTLIGNAAVTRFSLTDPYLKWLVHIIFLVTFFFQTLNSSINIFVYYSMSTRFRGVFKDVFFPKETS